MTREAITLVEKEIADLEFIISKMAGHQSDYSMNRTAAVHLLDVLKTAIRALVEAYEHGMEDGSALITETRLTSARAEALEEAAKVVVDNWPIDIKIAAAIRALKS